MNFSIPTIGRLTAPLVDSARRVVSVASRFTEWRQDRKREARIRDLRLRMSVAFAARDHLSVAAIGRELFAECDARSPAQCRRMEKRLFASLDPHARAVFERVRQ